MFQMSINISISLFNPVVLVILSIAFSFYFRIITASEKGEVSKDYLLDNLILQVFKS